MLTDDFFADKQILLVEKDIKKTNDRTWCFWEKEAGFFESIVHHRWEQLDFFSKGFSSTLSIQPYQYKMIRGADLYTALQTRITQSPQVTRVVENVQSVYTDAKKGRVVTDVNEYTADYVFNSVRFPGREKKDPKAFHLLQHFKGWLIQASEPVFDPSRACFMDFRVSQDKGTAFMYVLPLSATTALVEYTLFTEAVLEPGNYDEALRLYIGEDLGISAYTIIHEEFGIIPMTNEVFPIQEDAVVNIGIAGGQAKGSSGYAFQFIQKRADTIIRQLKENRKLSLQRKIADKKFNFYDAVLLRVLTRRKMSGDAIFSSIFRDNDPETVLRFLDNKSSFLEDLRIMRSVPISVFLPAAVRQLFS